MSDTTRTILIALGAALLVVVLLPLLFVSGMTGNMMGGGCCNGAVWFGWVFGLFVLAAGAALLVVGLRRR